MTCAVSVRALSVLALCLLAGHAAAVADDAAPVRKGVVGMVNEGLAFQDTGLPNFDARLDRKVDARRPAHSAAYLKDLAKLQAKIDGLTVDDDQFFGTPRFVRSTRQLLTAPAAAAPRDVLFRFAREYRGLLGISESEILSNRFDRDFVTDHNGVRHLTIIQQYAGVDILNAELKANITRKGELINISSTLLDRPAGDFAPVAGTLSDADAIALAAAACGAPIGSELTAETAPTGTNLKRTWKTPTELRANDALETSFTWFALDSGTIRPAWNVAIAVKGIGHTYDVVIDAADGTMLARTNRLSFFQTQPMSFRVYTTVNPNPGPTTLTPDGTQYAAASRTLVTVNPADYLAFSPLGWIADGGTTTVGNNVIAYPDTNNSNTVDEAQPTSATRVFDFAMDITQAPSTYLDAATTQLFYLANVYHDRLYALGFNEAASNFQQSNFTFGGAAGDRILAETQDGSGTNNANFSTTGTDGSVGRVQMYNFTAPTPDRDGSFDRDVVYHELTHGTSIRLHRGLNANQSAGMGEGWSDFFAIGLGQTAADNPNAPIASGAYASYLVNGNTSSNYFGIRRYPYSTNFNINPLTFKSIDPGQATFPSGVPRGPIGSTTVSAVHNVGEVWCNMLNECRVGLITARGWPGNELMLQLTVDGMKLSPTNPTFVQSRDAILQADLVSSGGDNAGTLWTAFAKRGIGFGAVAPANTTTSGVVESFNQPIYVTFSFPDGRPTQILPDGPTTIRVSAAGTGLTISPDSGTVTWAYDTAVPQTTPMTETAPGQYIASIPAGECFSTLTYSFAVNTSAGLRASPTGAPTESYSGNVYSGRVTTFADNFEAARGWTVGPNTATAGLWVRGVPIATAAQPGSGSTGAGTQCFFTGQGATGGAVGAADIDGGFTTLTSPVLNLAGTVNPVISYARWYSNGAGASPFADTFAVDVSTNGGATWVRAETIGPGSAADPNTNPGWIQASWSLLSLGLAPTNNVRVRFVADDSGSGSVVEAAIDEFTVSDLVCTPPTVACSIADVAGGGDQGNLPDGTLDGSDFIAFINSFGLGDATIDATADVAGGGSNGDQPDGTIDGSDFIAFINAFALGC